MFRHILVRLGILSPPTLTKTDYLVTVFVTSEGTAQGIPRPLQVFKLPLSYSTNMNDRWETAAEILVDCKVSSIIRRGYTHTLADGTKVTYAPHTIYKVISKGIENT
ncbi:hypothetical protein LCGC14_0244100 [marine sediment metagenome]|uniref:Uncharacterized protein n=1 Tax=marine sediment metagenome TaxID=412755 RepID=A0A0F9XB18_9ZZZZ